MKGFGKAYYGLRSREEAIALVLSTAMAQLDAQTVPDTGGISLGVMALAGTALEPKLVEEANSRK